MNEGADESKLSNALSKLNVFSALLAGSVMPIELPAAGTVAA